MAEKTEPVHFFDITSVLEGPRKSWSPNTLKTRAVLNIKGIPYTQSFISYPDIAPLSKGLEIPPTPEEGTPILYTLPAIIHKASIKFNPHGAMHDSLPIALHLDKAFPAPAYPSVFPHGQTSVALALAVDNLLTPAIRKSATILWPGIAEILDERGSEYFDRTRVPGFQKEFPHIQHLADLKPKTKEKVDQIVAETKKELAVFDEVLAAGGENKGVFLEGEKPGFADVMLAVHLAWIERSAPEFFEIVIDAGNGSLRKHWEASQEFLNKQGETKEWSIPKI
ncbi:glutathione S-transferase, putative [Talaromyces stipitatus ATCC 10500]|uniref:Glutathione S-transferase, putative n=1 Tax=Talaromyces stipitatus (strain ATCC 10500 / CBS 375.48 / QM 6759 / NRRL 1006) TaxID=441959 RepID=B8MTG9_TALSN|nr:glutathione S-transferase, putative [Talaromyces stipitatus ATCC 10500]EED12301.1 glutathione S-transferase, putative [Talaromyces stipitatus ATCC 10500]